MTNRQLVKSLSRSSKSTSSSNIQLHICGVPFSLDRELVAGRSAKIFVLLEENPNGDISHLLRDIPADPEAFELVVQFCHGFELNISAENIVPLSCLAHYLGMTETHSPDNLLKKALTYFERTIIPSWNESVKALQASEKVLKQAASLGLVDACAESIIAKAQVNPRHLGDPIMNSMYKDDDGEDKENGYRPNERRRLFVLDRLPEGLTILSLEILSLQLYEPIVREMIQRQVPPEYVAASVCQYAKKWVFSSTATGDDMSIYKRNSQREAIEAVERLLPLERGLLPCTLLFEMLNSAIFLEASSECRAGFEIRVGKQLDQAKVNDLLIPSQGYAKEVEYDVECVQRILKNFYCNYTHSDVSGLIKVAELVENLLAEVASDVDLKTSTFITLAEMTTSASVGMHRNSDGIYRAIDLYLDKHRFLTESEREEVCKVLDCHNLSPKAREQAAQNRQLPLRVVVQVLFVGQLSLRERVTKEVEASDERLRKVVAEEEEEEEEEAARVSGGEDEVRVEMEKMGSKVMELERECLMMRREIQSGCCGRAKREKTSVWREVKRKFGCVSSMHDCNCHVIKKKKVHPRQ